MKKRSNVFLVDGNNMLHRSFHKFSRMSYNGLGTGAIFGFFHILTPLIHRFKPNIIIVVFDAHRPKGRIKLYPEYKAKRNINLSYDKDDMMRQMDAIKKVLYYLGVCVIHDKKMQNDWEADDYIAYIANEVYSKDKVTILSSDKDYNQLITSSIRVFNPGKNQLITPSNCRDLFGYSAHKTVDYLTLVGDSSDNIKGIPGYGEKKSIKLLDEYGSIKEAIEAGELKVSMDKRELNDIIRRNKKLIDLKVYYKKVAPVSKKGIPLKVSSDKSINHSKISKYIKMYGLSSFNKPEFEEAYKTYNKNRIL